MAAKRRADQLLVERGLAESRTKAQALILAGLVSCGERRVDKPGEQLAADAVLALEGRDHPWVSRGGVKLAHALDHFRIAVEGSVALDIGASTGGFTDVLLSRGARRVHAVDVGYGQLAWKLRQDPRVVVHERLNARYLIRADIPEPIDIITCDASFIGLDACCRRRLRSPPSKPNWWRSSSRNSRPAARMSARAGSCATLKFIAKVCERGRVGRRTAGLGGERDRREPDPRPRGQPRISALCSPRRRGEAMTAAVTGFAGFRPAAFAFLNDLRDNNDPAWFKPRKALYEAEVLAPFRDLIAAVGTALGEAGLPLVGDPRRGIFRIYRDVRFSPDKRLYKTHAGAVLTRSGGRRDPGVLYIHVAPGESMVAAGFWHPEPHLLARLRRAVLADPDGFLAIVDRLAAAGCPLSSDDRLSRPPRGFEAAKGTPVAEYVGWKSFTAHRMLSDAEMQSPALVGRIADFAHTVLPLLEWGWAAADDEAPPPLSIRKPARPLPKPDF